jgi:hypothetical protein
LGSPQIYWSYLSPQSGVLQALLSTNPKGPVWSLS